MTVNDQITRLPDAYAKSTDSIVYKLLHLDASDRDELRTEFDKICAWQSIDDAEGVVLDQIGRDLQQPRGGLNDIEYRRWLRLKIIVNLSAGETERFNEVLTIIMQGAFIGVREGWSDQNLNEPASVVLRYDSDILFEAIRKSYEATTKDYDYTDVLNSILGIGTMASRIGAAGVRVYWEPISSASLTISPHENEAHPVLTIGPAFSERYDGSYQFSGETFFDGGYAAIQTGHEESLSLYYQAATEPVNLFEGLTQFNGPMVFDNAREIAVHDSRLIIRTPVDSAFAVEHDAVQTVGVGPAFPRFAAELVFDGGWRFDGYTALWADQGVSGEVSLQAVVKPESLFDMFLRFDGDLSFDGRREAMMNMMSITEVTA